MNGRDPASLLLVEQPDMKRLFTPGFTAGIIAKQGILDEGLHFLQKLFSLNEPVPRMREALDAKEGISS